MKKNKPSYAGVDGCKAGWMMVSCDDEGYAFGVFENIHELIRQNPDIRRFLIDIPVGLGTLSHPRTIDKKLRGELGVRASTVFNTPSRAAVYAENYAAARIKNLEIEGKSISIQSFNISAKIKEVDTFLIQNPQVQLLESHPELCFKYLNEGKIVLSKKSSPEGVEERLNILEKYDTAITHFFKKALDNTLRKQAKKDDIIDAICLCLVNRLADENLAFLSDRNLFDKQAIEMKIAYFKT